MPSLVQISHSGKQKDIGNKSNKHYTWLSNNPEIIIRNWNTEKKHYRKLLKSKGKYVCNILQKDCFIDDLYFWGEWEPCSFFKKLNIIDQLEPNGIHVPFLCKSQLKNCDITNTDPFVFGKYFHFTICKQKKTLRNLPENSIILFGSEFPDPKNKKNSFFALDTVFVVGFSIEAKDFKLHSNEYSPVFRDATINRLESYTNRCSPYRLYNGKMWEKSKDIFSFVPCKPSTVKEKPYDRFRISEDLFKQFCISVGSRQTGGRIIREIDPIETWGKIVNEVLKNDFCLGVHIEEPNYLNRTQIKVATIMV